MSRSSVVLELSSEHRAALDRKLVERGFSGYTDLTNWLHSLGYTISRSAVHRYGTRYEQKLDQIRLSTEMANALVNAAPDDAGAMADASIRLVQDRMFDLLLKSEEGDLRGVASAARAIAETARASTTIRAERRRILAEAKQKVRDVGQSKGLSQDVMDAIDAVLMPGDAP